MLGSGSVETGHTLAVNILFVLTFPVLCAHPNPLAESFLQEQLQSHLHDLAKSISVDSEEMLQLLQA
jgi:uncharacterized membrane protein YgcG